MSERTVTVAEAAQVLGITEKAVRRRIERGVLPSLIGPDKRRRIPASALGLDVGGASDGAAPAAAGRAAASGYGRDALELVERLARENGQLRQIEAIASNEREQLIRAEARVQTLEILNRDLATEVDQLRKRRRWPWRRREES